MDLSGSASRFPPRLERAGMLERLNPGRSQTKAAMRVKKVYSIGFMIRMFACPRTERDAISKEGRRCQLVTGRFDSGKFDIGEFGNASDVKQLRRT